MRLIFDFEAWETVYAACKHTSIPQKLERGKLSLGSVFKASL